MTRRLLPVLALATALLAGCSGATHRIGAALPGRLQVVAAEDVWGSIASQLGGNKVQVTNIIVNPSIDPHSYEPTAADAIAVARSRLAIVNGIGYDPWATQLIDANASSARTVLNVGSLLGLKSGANPHQWYSPSSVHRVIAQIVADYQRLDPSNAAYYARQRTSFQKRALARYDGLLRAIRARYAGVPVGFSESIFEPLGNALRLRLMTPASFAAAISEGVEISAADAQTVDALIRDRRIKVWVYNTQNQTPDVQRVTELARAARIPIATITETLAPASATFEQWQSDELAALERALAQAAGR